MAEEGGASPKGRGFGEPGVPLNLENLSPEEAAAVLKRHNPRLVGSTELLAEMIRRVRAGVKPLDQDVESVLREMLLEPDAQSRD